MSKIHPLDFGKLSKGTWLEAEELEEATLCKRDDPKFPLRVLGLREAIEARTGILSRADEYRVRLMTDSEAMVWTIGQSAEASRKLDRNARRMQENIDRSQLNDQEQVVHEHAERVISAMAFAQREERKKGAKLFSLVKRPELESGDGRE